MPLCPTWPPWLLQIGSVSSLLTLSTSSRWRCEGNRVKPCVFIYHLPHAAAYLWSWGVFSQLEDIRVLHLLSAILFLQRPLCKWRGGMIDLWYNFPMLVLAACPQFAKNSMKSSRGTALLSIRWPWPVPWKPAQTWPGQNPPGNHSCCTAAGLYLSHLQRPLSSEKT